VNKQDIRRTTTVTTDVDRKKTELTAEEERILRMRAGSTVPDRGRLGSKLDGVNPEHKADVAAKLAAMEAEILAALDANPELRRDRKKRIVEALRESDIEK
tara:strand:+ start:442 stop:744 length:303 start_codon:yes stop_codon:yes gene_type:complete